MFHIMQGLVEHPKSGVRFELAGANNRFTPRALDVTQSLMKSNHIHISFSQVGGLEM